MNLQRVVLPEHAAQQVAGLPVEVRQQVEAFLENLDVLLRTSRPASISQRFEREDTGGFVARVEGATLFFSLAMTACAAVVQQIELHTSSHRSTRGPRS